MKDTPVPAMSPEVADRLGEAMIRREKAESMRSLAEYKKLQAEARQAESLAARAMLGLERDEMDTEQRRQQFREYKAADLFHHVYYFSEIVCEASVEKCMAVLDLWERTEPGCSITLIFNSPGGSVVDGLALYDHIQMLKRKGHEVTTLAEGMAASMAGILLQAGGTRAMGKEAWILIHQVSAAMIGKFSEMEDKLHMLERVQERVLDIFAARSKEAQERGTATEPLTKEELKGKWERRDWWLSSEDALRYGIVDEVR